MVYAGEPYRQALRERLANVAVPTRVRLGESDGIVGPVCGRQFADLIPGARFDVAAEAGHCPQVRQLGLVVQVIRSLTARSTGATPPAALPRPAGPAQRGLPRKAPWASAVCEVVRQAIPTRTPPVMTRRTASSLARFVVLWVAVVTLIGIVTAPDGSSAYDVPL